MATEGKVKRLMTGPTLSVFSRSSLWLAEDHLLSVEQRGSNERYRRFYFEDIQALVICESERRFFIGLALGVFLFIGLLVTLLSDSFGGRVFGGSLAGVFGLLTLINLLKGPCCVCNLRTAVSETRLPAVRRLRKFERILPVLSARIAEKQGERDRVEIVAELETRRQAAPDASAGPDAPGAAATTSWADRPPERISYSGGYHFALFSLLLADAAMGIVMFFGNHPVLAGGRILAIMSGLFCGIVAFSRHKRARAPTPLRISTIAATVYLCVTAVMVYGLFVGVQIRDPDDTTDTMELLRIVAEASPFDGTGWLLLFTATAGLSALLGAIGVLHTMGYRTKKDGAAIPPLPPG